MLAVPHTSYPDVGQAQVRVPPHQVFRTTSAWFFPEIFEDFKNGKDEPLNQRLARPEEGSGKKIRPGSRDAQVGWMQQDRSSSALAQLPSLLYPNPAHLGTQGASRLG